MANTLTQAVLSTKPVVNVNTNMFTATFDMFDFSPSTSDATVEGPLSLVLDISNDRAYDMYVGLQVQTQSGIVSIGDRKHIGFVLAGTRQVITSASVPQLAFITGTIVKIIVTLYGLYDIPQLAPATTVSIRLSPASTVFAPQPYIGADDSAIRPSFHKVASFTTAAPANTNGTPVCSITVNGNTVVQFRYAIKRVSILVPQTPYASDIIMRLETTDRFFTGETTFLCASVSDRVLTFDLYPEIILEMTPSVPLIQAVLYADNSNTTNAYSVKASIQGELLF